MLQTDLFPPECSWKAPRLADLPQDWGVYSRVCVDVETRDEDLRKLGPGVRRGAYIVGVCLGFEARAGGLVQRKSFYLPIRHLGGDNCEEGPEGVLRYVREQARFYSGDVVGAKLDYDLDFLAEEGVEWCAGAHVKDVQVAEPLLDELQFTYGLDAILGRHGLPPKDEVGLREACAAHRLKDPKKEMWKLPGRYLGEYGARDALAPLELLERQELLIEKRGLQKIWELEQLVTPLLVKMRRRGVRVDPDQLDRMEQFSLAEEQKAWDECERQSGVRIKVGDAMKAEVVNQALEALDIYPTRTSKGGPSITKEWLEGLNHPLGAVVRRARKMSQMRTTFVASVRAHTIRGRIHCTFNQIAQADDEGGTKGVRYGRLSCQDPNLQQQPARDPEIGPAWRKVYVPDPGGLWCSDDYSQQEPRLAVHTAVSSGADRIGRAAWRSAMDAARRYQDDRDTDAHTMFCQMVHSDFPSLPKEKSNDGWTEARAKQTRTIYKNTYLGLCYGEGEAKMCRDLGLETEYLYDERRQVYRERAGPEGRRIFDLIEERVPYVRATAKAVERVAKARGYVMTVMGRQLHFPKDAAGNYDYTHKAFNRVIQGNAADQTKKAMVELDRAGFPIQLQVHDELCWTVVDRAEGERAARIMEECFPLHVPSKVDVEVGPSWGEAK